MTAPRSLCYSSLLETRLIAGIYVLDMVRAWVSRLSPAAGLSGPSAESSAETWHVCVLQIEEAAVKALAEGHKLRVPMGTRKGSRGKQTALGDSRTANVMVRCSSPPQDYSLQVQALQTILHCEIPALAFWTVLSLSWQKWHDSLFCLASRSDRRCTAFQHASAATKAISTVRKTGMLLVCIFRCWSQNSMTITAMRAPICMLTWFHEAPRPQVGV